MNVSGGVFTVLITCCLPAICAKPGFLKGVGPPPSSPDSPMRGAILMPLESGPTATLARPTERPLNLAPEDMALLGLAKDSMDDLFHRLQARSQIKIIPFPGY